MRQFLVGAAASLGVLAAAAIGPAGAQEQQFISIGTGGVTGVYYPTGGAICRLVNKTRKEHGIRCSVESTGGSVYNINTLQSGELEFGVAQSDVQFNAFEGKAQWDGKPFEKLRAVFSVHPEPVTIIARDDSGIENITDLKGKRVNIGNPGSGTRATWDVIETALGWSRDDLKLAAELKSAEQGQALCDNKIDAFFWLVGHPSANTQETLATCDSHLVNAMGEEIDGLVEERPYYRKATIPAGMYPGQDGDVNTFGVGATLVTSADVPEEVVYILTKSVMENLDEFKKLHPAFANLTAEEMVSASLSAPLHPGAEKAYKELGLIE
ncbi:TAXI family TRAP transporter solute-binding subunit [Kaustia mangrovi]|uniref:TAXI family TRAP transporter solute-binding subunit n=1 Tax=Kaustia mangrovi TaxID=2593653 RepID=A0A7S8C5R6_9HYPH|nr:TAXI family TRAP transporter solute-binding subunit [Kaustia mangrovi]QPC43910.1 TAXI family TRAP transporter solute-binding subunit [Kaustia mangrovi]